MLAAAPLVFSWMAPTPVLHRIGVRAAVNRMQAIDDHVTNTHMDDDMHRMHRSILSVEELGLRLKVVRLVPHPKHSSPRAFRRVALSTSN